MLGIRIIIEQPNGNGAAPQPNVIAGVNALVEMAEVLERQGQHGVENDLQACFDFLRYPLDPTQPDCRVLHVIGVGSSAAHDQGGI